MWTRFGFLLVCLLGGVTCTQWDSVNQQQTSQNCPTPCPACPSCPKCPNQLACPSPCSSTASCPSPCPVPTPCPQCPSCPAYPPPPQPPPCPAPARRIPPGYEHFPGLGYYKLHSVPLNWYDAKATCEREGAHLVIINSQAEADLLVRLFARDPKIEHAVFVGFHDIYHEGHYVTVLGQSLGSTGYTQWDLRQPDNVRDEDCGSIHQNGRLNDLKCHVTKNFICELP